MRMWLKNFGVINVCLCVALFATACGGDDKKSDDNGAKKEGTAGGETRTGLDVPPGSKDPTLDDDPTNDGGDASTTSADNSGGAKKNPWGATKSEQCKAPKRPAVSNAALRLTQEGVAALHRADLGAARNKFNSAVSTDSKTYAAVYHLGLLADYEGRESEAVSTFQKALTIAPDYAPAAEGVCRIYVRQRRVSEAVRFSEAIARRYPTSLAVQALYAEMLVLDKKYEMAWEAARKALKCDERNVPALTAIVHASLAQGRKEMARSVLKQALAVDPNDGELHYIQGTLHEAEPGMLAQALKEYELAVKYQPDHVAARTALGIVMLNGGSYDKAFTHLSAAAKYAPRLVAVHLNLGDAYRAKRNWAAAKMSYDKALKLEPNTPEVYYGLGHLYWTAGDKAPGMNELQALSAAKESFQKYRALMGPKLKRNDETTDYLADIGRQIDRVKRRMEREARNAEKS